MVNLYDPGSGLGSIPNTDPEKHTDPGVKKALDRGFLIRIRDNDKKLSLDRLVSSGCPPFSFMGGDLSIVEHICEEMERAGCENRWLRLGSWEAS